MIATSCGTRRFVTVAGEPYLPRNPNGVETRFSDLLNPFGDLGNGWVEFSEAMPVIITAAYHEPGSSGKGLAGYLGMETSTFRIIKRRQG